MAWCTGVLPKSSSAETDASLMHSPGPKFAGDDPVFDGLVGLVAKRKPRWAAPDVPTYDLPRAYRGGLFL